MAKKNRKRRGAKKHSGVVEPSNALTGRNRALDSLRGVAILLMIVDHVAFLFFDQNIELGQLRFFTRLSMPLFCILGGYLAAGKETVNWMRIAQVAVAACIVNLLYFPAYGQLEILVSLLLCYLGYAMIGKWMMLCAGGALLYAWDPTASSSLAADLWSGKACLLDFPFTIVATPFALGILLRKFGLPWAVGALLLLLPAIWLIPEPTVFVLWLTPVALLLVAGGCSKPSYSLRPLELIGRYPLRIYATQYVVLLGLALLTQQ